MMSRLTPGLLVGLAALAAPAAAPAASNTARYRLTVELKAEAVYSNEVDEKLRGRGRQNATCRARTKRPFTIRRIPRRAGPRFSFTAPVSGEFTWRGSGFGGVGSAAGGCVFKWTDDVWPDQTLVSGWVSSRPTAIPRIGIFVTPDAGGQVGTVTFDPNARCEKEVRPFYASSLTLLILPEQRTDPVAFRKRFGRSFTVPYAPGAVRDLAQPRTAGRRTRGVRPRLEAAVHPRAVAALTGRHRESETW